MIEATAPTSHRAGPDFNPIEQAFSKLQTQLPNAAERTILNPGSPIDWVNYVANVGYEPDRTKTDLVNRAG